MEPSSTETSPAFTSPRHGAKPVLREWANGFALWPAGWHAGGWGPEFAVASAAGICLGVLGPFGSFLNGPLPARLGYWVGALWLGTAILGVMRRAFARLASRRHLPAWLAHLAATLLAAVPVAFLTHALAMALWSGPIRSVSGLTWYAETLVINALMSLAYAMGGDSAAPATPAPTHANFLARLPPQLGRDLLALQMEDHYVRAHTSLGSAMILIPLHQAIRELHAVPGLRIHRSWWVARRAVSGSTQDGRNIRLRLTNGLLAPVARASVSQVRAAGWL